MTSNIVLKTIAYIKGHSYLSDFEVLQQIKSLCVGHEKGLLDSNRLIYR